MTDKVSTELLNEAMDCDQWPLWLHEIVDEVIGNDADLSTEQSIGLGVLLKLHSLRNAQSEAVAVKALEWKPNSASSLWTGELAFGVYYVAYDEGDGWRAFRRQFMSEIDGVEVAFGAKDTVLSAAQSDFDKRIRSALTHPAPPLAVTDERITEAVDLIGEASGYTGDPDALRLINKALEALTADLEAKQ